MLVIRTNSLRIHLLRADAQEVSAEVKSVNERKKNIPRNIYIITADKECGREVIAKAMAEMYRRMLNPV